MSDKDQTDVEAQALLRQNTENMVEVKARLPKKWVSMIVTLQEWEDKDIDVGEYVREAVRSNLHADLESMWQGPVSEEGR
ncbi:hypothetical protein [Methanoregula formicica]|uniref:Uncharacterized protein n=1 Tax=Methanoregula formicica (strain DSM 22288 / NBRC 105244 / SMSP) TaxID=593750 RepID=L0HGF8_METFS|nr:hypothetical protein [Methanoregula formicica]AGB02408.1 hypothetical protein Metfor_1369 [Methanoregula formicica SMSP]